MREESLEELRKSIREEGVLVPLVVVQEGEQFRVICGKRRAMCAQSLGLGTIAAIVVEPSAGFEMWAAITENRLREPLNVLDMAEYLAGMMTALPYTEAQVAKELGVSVSWVQQRLAVLRWPESLRTAVGDEKISFSVARELSGISDETELGQCVWQAVSGGCTVRQAAEWRREWEQRSAAPKQGKTEGPVAEPVPAEAAAPSECMMCAGASGSVSARKVVLCQFCYSALEKARTTDNAPS